MKDGTIRPDMECKDCYGSRNSYPSGGNSFREFGASRASVGHEYRSRLGYSSRAGGAPRQPGEETATQKTEVWLSTPEPKLLPSPEPPFQITPSRVKIVHMRWSGMSIADIAHELRLWVPNVRHVLQKLRASKSTIPDWAQDWLRQEVYSRDQPDHLTRKHEETLQHTISQLLSRGIPKVVILETLGLHSERDASLMEPCGCFSDQT